MSPLPGPCSHFIYASTVVITVVLNSRVLMVVLLMVAVVHALAISSSNGNDGSSCNDIMIITKGKA